MNLHDEHTAYQQAVEARRRTRSLADDEPWDTKLSANADEAERVFKVAEGSLLTNYYAVPFRTRDRWARRVRGWFRRR